MNCQRACKKCDDMRPCQRCVRYGIIGTCTNSTRKDRQSLLEGQKSLPFGKSRKSSRPKNEIDYDNFDKEILKSIDNHEFSLKGRSDSDDFGPKTSDSLKTKSIRLRLPKVSMIKLENQESNRGVINKKITLINSRMSRTMRRMLRSNRTLKSIYREYNCEKNTIDDSFFSLVQVCSFIYEQMNSQRRIQHTPYSVSYEQYPSINSPDPYFENIECPVISSNQPPILVNMPTIKVVQTSRISNEITESWQLNDRALLNFTPAPLTEIITPPETPCSNSPEIVDLKLTKSYN